MHMCVSIVHSQRLAVLPADLSMMAMAALLGIHIHQHIFSVLAEQITVSFMLQ